MPAAFAPFFYVVGGQPVKAAALDRLCDRPSLGSGADDAARYPVRIRSAGGVVARSLLAAPLVPGLVARSEGRTTHISITPAWGTPVQEVS